MEAATYARDLPGMADIDFSLLAFCGQINKHVKVALSGECADEIFGGYPWFRDPQIRPEAGFPWSQNITLRSSMLHAHWKRNTEEFVRCRYDETLQQCDILPENTPQEKKTKQMVNLNYRWFMQTLLDRKDRMSMYHSLEVRVPFCDHRIAEYMYAVPWEYKEYRGTEKGLLRYAMKDYLPQNVLWRKKSPYPKTYDPKYLQLVTDAFLEILNDSNAPIFQIADKNALHNLLDYDSTWPWYGQLMKKPQTLAYMVMLNYWMNYYRVSVI
jgi:asparagine synthase (glutamine-hydrolysing)